MNGSPSDTDRRIPGAGFDSLIPSINLCQTIPKTFIPSRMFLQASGGKEGSLNAVLNYTALLIITVQVREKSLLYTHYG